MRFPRRFTPRNDGVFGHRGISTLRGNPAHRLLGSGGGVLLVALLLFPMSCNKATTFSRFHGLSVKYWCSVSRFHELSV